MATAQTEVRLPTRRQRKKPNTIRVVEETPTQYASFNHPTNLVQQRERFLKYGILPQFILRASTSKVEAHLKKPGCQISHQYINQARHILQLVKERFKTGDEYVLNAFGPPVDVKLASSCLTEYLNSHGLDGQMNIVFSNDLDCSAKMMWHGPHVKQKKPEARRHTLIIKNSPENFYMREQGITCLANHEVGTHYLRTINEGLQPWYGDRKTFGLRLMSSYEFKKTEEGLATLNTILQAKVKYLYNHALSYYAACMSETMTFKELFHHLEEFLQDEKRRWQYVMRVKRNLPDPNDLGGTGSDQCYFEGAMEILLNIETLDFPLLYSGTVCMDELNRVKRLARLDCIKLPNFLQDVEAYKQQLRWIGYANGILPKPQPRKFKVKRPTGMKSQQGIRPALRESSSIRPHSRQGMDSGQAHASSNMSRTPSNLVLIDDSTSGMNSPLRSDRGVTNSSELPMIDAHRARRPESTDSTLDEPVVSTCILEKLSSRLSFHDDLIKRVESKLKCASLSLKQSEHIMLRGVKGKQGLATASTPPPMRRSPDCYYPSKWDLCEPKDQGSYTVQSSPPTGSSSNKV